MRNPILFGLAAGIVACAVFIPVLFAALRIMQAAGVCK